MDTTISLNILFLVISIFMIFFGVTLTILLIYIALFFKKLNSFINIIEKETGKISQDIENVREKIKRGENMFFSFIAGVKSFFKIKEKSRKNNNK
jgi:uncharacterized protein YoxC